eukprot:8452134-Karenia_brevis.AAC.1
MAYLSTLVHGIVLREGRVCLESDRSMGPRIKRSRKMQKYLKNWAMEKNAGAKALREDSRRKRSIATRTGGRFMMIMSMLLCCLVPFHTRTTQPCGPNELQRMQ